MAAATAVSSLSCPLSHQLCSYGPRISPTKLCLTTNRHSTDHPTRHWVPFSEQNLTNLTKVKKVLILISHRGQCSEVHKGWYTVVADFLLTLQPKGGSSAQGSTGLSSETVRLCCPLWHLFSLKNSDKEGKFAFTLALCKQLLLSLCTKCLLQPRYKGVSFHVCVKWNIMEALFIHLVYYCWGMNPQSLQIYVLFFAFLLH